MKTLFLKAVKAFAVWILKHALEDGKSILVDRFPRPDNGAVDATAIEGTNRKFEIHYGAK